MTNLTLVATIAGDGDAIHGGPTPSFLARRDALRGDWAAYLQVSPPWRVKYEREGSDRRRLLDDYFFVRPEYSHLLWLDDDVLVEPDTLEQLLAADVPVVSALFPDPVKAGNVLCYPKYLPGEGVRPIRLGCIGCTLLTRDVAEALRGWPWVDLNGSDTHFWRKLEALGILKYVHTDVVVTMEPRSRLRATDELRTRRL